MRLMKLTSWIVAAVLCAAPAMAQEPKTDAPAPQTTGTPADNGTSSSTSGTAGDAATSEAGAPQLVPDTQPLGGLTELTLGSSSNARNTFSPSFRFSQYIDSNVGSGVSSSGVLAVSNLSGTLQANRVWRQSSLGLNYVAGGTIFPANSDFNSYSQQLGLSYAVQMRRMSLSLSETGSYLPESAFGYNGIAGLGGGYGGGIYTPNVSPNQNILTGQRSRISSTSGAQMQYVLSGRASLHFSAAFGALRYQGSDASSPTVAVQNTNQWTFVAGYDRTLTAHDTLGLSFNESRFSYGGSDLTINTHSINLNYGRRITGKLALQLSGGPQIRTSDNLLLSETDATWNIYGGLRYQLARTGLSLSFSHNTTGGGGVFAGSQSDTMQGSVSRVLTRTWTAVINGGYARNATLSATSAADHVVNSEFGGVSVQRPLGHQMSLFFSYNLQHQQTDVPLCVGCGTTYMRHVGGIGFEWHVRPIVTGTE